MVIKSKLRLGIVGCGAITEGAHLPAVLASSEVELTALSDTNARRLRYLERQFGLGPIGCPDFRQIMDRVDAVILALPNALHAPVGVEFLSRGISVLCEKPLAVDRKECEQLCMTAGKNSATLAVGYVTRFFPSTSLTKQLIASGFLGRIRAFDYEFGTAGGWASISGYNLSRSAAGGGVLVVSGSHFVDRMLHLFGACEVVRHCDDSRGGVEANSVSWFRAALAGDPVEGRVALSKTHKLANRLRISGAQGILEIGEGQSRSVTYYPTGTDARHEITPRVMDPTTEEPDYFRVQLEDFARAVRTGTVPRVDGSQGAASVSVMQRCYEIATPLEEPWSEATLDRLRAALLDPPGAQVVMSETAPNSAD